MKTNRLVINIYDSLSYLKFESFFFNTQSFITTVRPKNTITYNSS